MQRKESRANQRTYSNGSMVSPGVCQGRTTSMSSSNFNLESEEDTSEPAKSPTSLARMDVVFENDAISYQPMGNGGGMLCYYVHHAMFNFQTASRSKISDFDEY